MSTINPIIAAIVIVPMLGIFIFIIFIADKNGGAIIKNEFLNKLPIIPINSNNKIKIDIFSNDIKLDVGLKNVTVIITILKNISIIANNEMKIIIIFLSYNNLYYVF